ncbi:hypothetical protein ENHY17A_350013 [Moraxellaceae bacterium 17A]|nr:hypothetical protein ENHY17A_350013 [Moraxellaceae bacterium 17A]
MQLYNKNLIIQSLIANKNCL